MTRKPTIGLVHNWPGKKNSEFDLIGRIRPLLQALDYSVLVMDPHGFELGENTERQGNEPIADGTCDVILNFHYINPKFFSGLSYTVNWNPIDYIINDPITGMPVPAIHLHYLSDCFRSHDWVLGAGSGLLDAFVATLREGRQGFTLPETGIELHTTIASTTQGSDAETNTPDAASFRVFYIGLNWEKMSDSADRKLRHEGLLELLDKSGRFRFFGLKQQSGIDLWEGFTHYEGELPFDGGQSIIAQSRQCGASLVISSPQHRESGVVSTRIFQACAAGTVVISDENPFVREHFGDSVLYFQYGATNRETADNILAQVDWIARNWQQANSMAAKAHARFVQHFALEQEVTRLCKQIDSDIAARAAILKKLASRAVAVHCILPETDYTKVQELLDNISRQSHRNFTIYLYLDSIDHAPMQNWLDDWLDEKGGDVPVRLCNSGAGDKTVGATLVEAAGTPEDYHLWYSPGFDWRKDHIANLLAVCELDKCDVAYSPYFAAFAELQADIDDTMSFFITGMNGGYTRLTESAIRQMDRRDLPAGNVLFRADGMRRVLSRVPMIALFDLGAISLVIKSLYEENNQAIGFSAVISSLFTETANMAHRVPFNEYEHVGQNRRHGLLRDKHLMAALMAGKPVLTSVKGKHELDFGSDDPLEVSALISRHLSVPMYIQHVLRDRPILRKVFAGLHHLLAWLLKPKR